MSRVKRGIKVLMQLTLFLLGILFALVVIIQIPGVQLWLTGKLETYLETTLKTEVRIEGIRLRLPESLVISGVYVEDQQRDTLLSLEELAVNFRLHQLLFGKVQLDQVSLNKGTFIYHQSTDSSNVDFMLQAFAPPSTDTFAAPKPSASAPPTFVLLHQTDLLLEDLDLRYQNEPAQQEARVNIGLLRTKLKAADYIHHQYQINKVDLRRSRFYVQAAPSAASSSPSPAVPLPKINVQLDQLHFQEVGLDLHQANQQLNSTISSLQLNDGQLQVAGDTLLMTLASFQLADTELQHRQAGLKASEHFDFNQFHFQGINIDLQQFAFNPDGIQVDIQQIAAREKKGWSLDQLQTKINLNFADSLRLQNLAFRTPNTQLTAPQLLLDYPIFAHEQPPLETLELAGELQLQTKNLDDLHFFYPQPDSLTFLEDLAHRPLRVQLAAEGSVKNLQVDQLQVRGWDTELSLSGSAKNVLPYSKMELDIQLDELATNQDNLLRWIPPNSLPTSIQLPDSIWLSGQLTGHMDNLQAQLSGWTSREGTPFSTQLKSKAKIQKILNSDSTQVYLQLDTFQTSKTDILAYLPTDAVPPSVTLPEQFILQGIIQGPLNQLQSNLNLVLINGTQQNQIQAIGSIEGLMTGQNPYLDISLSLQDLKQKDIQAYLPDSLLPAYLQVPWIKELTGTFKGSTEQFSTHLAANSNTGQWQVDAALDDQTYDFNLSVDELRMDAFFTPNHLDSAAYIPRQAYQLALNAKGKGFDLSPQSLADIKLKLVRSDEDSLASGLVLGGQLDQQIFRATARANEPALKLQVELLADYTDTAPRWQLTGTLDTLDLQRMGFASVPFSVKGNIQGKAKGDQQDQFLGKVRMNDLVIQYDEKTEQVDSIMVLAELEAKRQLLQIKANPIQAKLEGSFVYPRIQNALSAQFASLWSLEKRDSLLKNTADQFDLTIEVTQPEIFTLGYIPGLQVLAPFTIESHYNNQDASFQLRGELPYLNWQGYEVDRFNFNVDIDSSTAAYEALFEQMTLPQLAIHKGRFSGTLAQQQLNNRIELFDEQQQKWYDLKTFTAFTPQGIQLTLAPEVLLNYQDWSIPPNNQLFWDYKHLSSQQWRLSNGQESVEILNPTANQTQIKFTNYSLSPIGQLLQPEQKTFLGGTLNGQLSVEQLTDKPKLFTDLRIDSLQVAGAQLGQLQWSARSLSNRIQNQLELNGHGHELSLKGSYNFNQSDQAFDFKLDIASLQLSPLEEALKTYLSQPTGKLKGEIAIKGSLNQPSLRGQVQFQETAFDVELLNTRLSIGEQPIKFTGNKIEFANLEIQDANQQKGIISSYLSIENLQDPILHTTIDVKDFLVLNTKAKDNDLYYGKLLVDAQVQLSGSLQKPVIEITSKPKKNSSLTYLYSTASRELNSHEGIVEFVVQDTSPYLRQQRLIPISQSVAAKVILRLEVDKNLRIRVITNPLTGDYFEGQAKGNLLYTQNPDGSLELAGELEVIEGEYLFTYQSLVRRKFTVQPGGSLSWTGDPYTPTMNLQVSYQTRTSAYPLLASTGEELDANTRQKQTFRVNLAVTGTPADTKIDASFEYPSDYGNSGNTTIQEAIDDLNQNLGQNNNQAFALILFNGFLAQDIRNTDFQIIDFEGNLNEVITQRLNGIVNRYIKFVEVDINLDTYSTEQEESQTDLKVSIRKRFLNDRLAISLDGKTSNERGTEDGETQSYLDNITVEYALTPDGRFRIKVYNQQDFDDFIGGTGVKMGGAFIFSKEFTGIQLFSKKSRN